MRKKVACDLEHGAHIVGCEVITGGYSHYGIIDVSPAKNSDKSLFRRRFSCIPCIVKQLGKLDTSRARRTGARFCRC